MEKGNRGVKKTRRKGTGSRIGQRNQRQDREELETGNKKGKNRPVQFLI